MSDQPSLIIDSTPTYKFAPLYVIGSALAFTVGLAWNNAIQSIIKRYNPIDTSGPSIMSKLLYAIIVTIIVLMAVFVLNYLDQQSATLQAAAITAAANQIAAIRANKPPLINPLPFY